ncbi:MAG: hypothetical protein RIM23_24855 [Coleofasciculus sp. G3-WIS-01]|uniref:hypothetical protein n=1 Tax=Coleofasciculus sp. G3-WIS-01 TaxID=3069528 RepID=UPI0032F66923
MYYALNQAKETNETLSINAKIKTANLISFIYTLTVIFSSNFVSFSDIPWSHFPATLMGISCMLLIFYIEDSYKKRHYRRILFGLSLLGFSLGLLVQIRSFEGIALLLGIGTWLLLLALMSPIATLQKIKSRVNYFKLIKYNIVLGLSFLVTFLTSQIITHQKAITLLYFGLRDNHPVLKEMYKTYPDVFPVKFVQLFIDPNFFSFNQNYEINPLIFGFNFDVFKMPFLLQIPFLIYAIPATFTLLIFSGYKKNIKTLLKKASFVIPLITGLILTVAYLGSPLFGSPHLKYGVVRNMMLVTWCLALVAGPWHFFPTLLPSSRRFFPQYLVCVCILPILISVVYGQIIVHYTGFWEFEKMHIKKIELEENCQSLICSLNVNSYNHQKQVIKIHNQRYIVAASCPSTGKRMATTVSPDQSFTLLPCSERYQVNVYPINMGFAGTPDPEMPISWQFTPPPSQK